MSPADSTRPGDAHERVTALIETLHDTGQRQEHLMAGDGDSVTDTVTDRRSRTVFLRRAQDQLRHNEAFKQAAILNALPANIAVLDAQGFIISVNEAWRQFAGRNLLHGPDTGPGLNYLEVCDGTQGDDAPHARQAAAGVRSVLVGAVKSFSLEYAGHSPTEQRWSLMVVTPLTD
ncbi:MAG TPA: PAS domain-containing protein, partial [Rhodoferax sp.]